MKIINRIKTHATTSIVTKIQIRKTMKSEHSFLIESLSSNGGFLRDYTEKISSTEVKKLITFFEGKMKKFAFATTTPVYDTVETEYILLINPELMEKERVGFELYGSLGTKSANTDIVAYYSFADSGEDFRQVINNGEIYGFFSLTNFESSGGLKPALNELGVTYAQIEGTAANYMFLTMNEYKRQFKKDAIIEPKKRLSKDSKIPQEVKEVLDAVKKVTANDSNKSDETKTEMNNTSVKKSRGRPSKIETAKEDVKTEEPIKRGRGRPPKKV